MHPLRWLLPTALVLLVLLMVVHACTACHREFVSGQALSKHKRYCDVLVAARTKNQNRRRIQSLSAPILDLSDRKKRLQPPAASGLGLLTAKSIDPMDVDPPLEQNNFHLTSPMAEDSHHYISSRPPPPLPSPSPPPPPPQLTQSGRPRRERRLPKRFRDILPEAAAPIAAAPAMPEAPTDPEIEVQAEPTTMRRAISHLVTVCNSFGIWRDYPDRPSRDPDASLSLEDLASNSASFTSGTPTMASSGVPLDAQRALKLFNFHLQLAGHSRK